ncbi:MAG: ATP-binding protein [Dehalococcoidia bacterium]|nr:ATP-binding protein [Dehalococcoidia bacterium]
MQTAQPTAHLVCGFIGAGKTTFAREIEAETGAIRITKDEWVVRIFGRGIASDAEFEDYDSRVTELATELAFKLLEAGVDVILDEGYWTRDHRDSIKEKVASAGAKPVLYWVDCPVELMRERTVKRSSGPSTDSFEIDEEMFDRYLRYWEPPTAAETFVRVDASAGSRG